MDGMAVQDRQGGFIHADAAFRGGVWHADEGLPGQDYAMAFSSPLPFAVIADGCSQSGGSDVGARIIALAAARQLRGRFASCRMDRLRARILAAASQARRVLDIGPEALDATLGVVQSAEDGGVRTMLFGDGVIAARHRDGIDVTIMDWAGNMPGYLSYLLAPDRLAAFLIASESAARDEGRAACRITRLRIAPDGTCGPATQRGLDAAAGLRGIEIVWPGEADNPDTAPPDIVAVLSDGVLQIQGVGWADALTEIMDVKAAREGRFVARRMARALGRFARQGGRLGDDLAMGAVARPIL
jgi:hypothetical protein